jgi:hypothetical protein
MGWRIASVKAKDGVLGKWEKIFFDLVGKKLGIFI